MSLPGTSKPTPPARAAARLENPSAGRRRMLAAGVVSVLIHAVAAAILLAGTGGQGAARPSADLATPPPPSETPDPLTLGSDLSQSTSITWIGFDEYQEHVLREKSEVDQPELSLDDPAGMPTPPAVAQTAPAPRPAQQPQPQPAEPQEVVAEAKPRPPAPEPIDAEPPAPVITQAPDPDPVETEEAPQVAADEKPVLADRVGPLAPDPAPESESTSVETPVAQTPAESPAPQTPPQEPQEPVETAEQPPAQPSAAPGSEATGQHADREADAASIVTATVSKLGRPLVAHGLEIQTIRPRYTYYTQVTATPRPPIVRVQFDRSGKVYRAQILQSSGSADVDRPLLDAIYQWRAKGKQLEGLSAGNPPETVSIEFRILL